MTIWVGVIGRAIETPPVSITAQPVFDTTTIMYINDGSPDFTTLFPCCRRSWMMYVRCSALYSTALMMQLSTKWILHYLPIFYLYIDWKNSGNLAHNSSNSSCDRIQQRTTAYRRSNLRFIYRCIVTWQLYCKCTDVCTYPYYIMYFEIWFNFIFR